MLAITESFIQEIDAETKSTRTCLQRIPMELSEWKPQEKSMQLGYLALLVAEIPKCIQVMIEVGEIDFATYEHFNPKTTEELVAHLDKNIEGAKNALRNATEADLEKLFALKRGGEVMFSSPVKENLSSTINHWVHHRGQLTVYMRLNDIAVPSIYGPSADDRSF